MLLHPLCVQSPKSWKKIYTVVSTTRARFKHTARKTIKTRRATAQTREIPPRLISTRSSGTPSKQAHHKSKTVDKNTEYRRTKRFRPGALALKEIRRYQNSTELLMPRTSFKRTVREVARSLLADIRFQSTALMALHYAAEAYLVCTPLEKEKKPSISRLRLI